MRSQEQDGGSIRDLIGKELRGRRLAEPQCEMKKEVSTQNSLSRTLPLRVGGERVSNRIGPVAERQVIHTRGRRQ